MDLANVIASSDSSLPVSTASENAMGQGVCCPPGQRETSLCSTLQAFPKRIDSVALVALPWALNFLLLAEAK